MQNETGDDEVLSMEINGDERDLRIGVVGRLRAVPSLIRSAMDIPDVDPSLLILLPLNFIRLKVLNLFRKTLVP